MQRNEKIVVGGLAGVVALAIAFGVASNSGGPGVSSTQVPSGPSIAQVIQQGNEQQAREYQQQQLQQFAQQQAAQRQQEQDQYNEQNGYTG